MPTYQDNARNTMQPTNPKDMVVAARIIEQNIRNLLECYVLLQRDLPQASTRNARHIDTLMARRKGGRSTTPLTSSRRKRKPR